MATNEPSVAIAPETYASVAAYCKDRGLKIKWAVTKAVEEYMKRHK
jgi:hypothetical protein